jgi:hypothetical protein
LPAWQSDRQRQSVRRVRTVIGHDHASVLSLALGELNVIKHDPDVGGGQFLDDLVPWEEIGLMDRHAHRRR